MGSAASPQESPRTASSSRRFIQRVQSDKSHLSREEAVRSGTQAGSVGRTERRSGSCAEVTAGRCLRQAWERGGGDVNGDWVVWRAWPGEQRLVQGPAISFCS